jgi:8-oxo-dGTP diphosphatase
MTRQQILAASAVIFDPENRVLLIKRGHEPALGFWSVPGGSVEAGESLEEAAAREVLEETGLAVTVGAKVWVATVPLSAEADYEIHAFSALVVGGSLLASDDAADARWVSAADFMALPTTPRLLELLTQAGWNTA